MPSLNSGEPVPIGLLPIFEKLAILMEMEGDEEFQGIARLRAGAQVGPA